VLLAAVTDRFRAAGFDEVEVDPAGYRQGALNERTAGSEAPPGSAHP
jgi:PP-loop superfamily ATP-utilizing enzyme